MTGTCRLCGESCQLGEDSHIIPAFFFRWLKESSATGYFRDSGNINLRVQDGFKLPFLCESCEDVLGKSETKFSRDVFYPFVKDDGVICPYDEHMLRFGVSLVWRALKYSCEHARMEHFRGRHLASTNSALETWAKYLLRKSDSLGAHEIHLLPFSGAIDYAGAEQIPRNLNHFLRRSAEFHPICSDEHAASYVKMGPFIFFGLICYPNTAEWVGTKIEKAGIFQPGNFTALAGFGNYVVKRAEDLNHARTRLSQKQSTAIGRSFQKNIPRALGSDTLKAQMLDQQLRQSEERKA